MKHKSTLILLLLLFSFLSIKSQNLQLRFDYRKSLYKDNAGATSNYLTLTYELFKPDKWGSTFLFVDFYFNLNKNIGLAYTEISRNIKIKEFPIEAHIEYNGGLGSSFSIQNSYLIGGNYPFVIGNVYMSTYLAYKLNNFERKSNDFQWTVTWSGSLCDNKIKMCGFIDFWTENKNKFKTEGPKGKEIIVLTQPQIWYNLTENFSLGSVIICSYNLINKNKIYCVPTIAAQWNF